MGGIKMENKWSVGLGGKYAVWFWIIDSGK